MPTPKDIALSAQLQGIAGAIDDVLASTYGERMGFVLVVSPLNRDTTQVQYVANVDRGGGTTLLQALLDRWKANQPDIPVNQKR